MATIAAGMSMSLDGFVVGPFDGVGHLFGWCFNGDVEVVTDGLESALEQAKIAAGEKVVGVASATSPSSASAQGCWTSSG